MKIASFFTNLPAIWEKPPYSHKLEPDTTEGLQLSLTKQNSEKRTVYRTLTEKSNVADKIKHPEGNVSATKIFISHTPFATSSFFFFFAAKQRKS